MPVDLPAGGPHLSQQDPRRGIMSKFLSLGVSRNQARKKKRRWPAAPDDLTVARTTAGILGRVLLEWALPHFTKGIHLKKCIDPRSLISRVIKHAEDADYAVKRWSANAVTSFLIEKNWENSGKKWPSNRGYELPTDTPWKHARFVRTKEPQGSMHQRTKNGRFRKISLHDYPPPFVPINYSTARNEALRQLKEPDRIRQAMLDHLVLDILEKREVYIFSP
jgi:hypothetical protein